VPDGPRYVGSLPRPLVRAALRRSGTLEPALRVFAEDLLGADATIDLVGVDPEGRVVVVQVGEEGEDRSCVVRALAQRAWVRPRLGDWLQLAPSLPFQPDAPVVAWLLCPRFSPDTLAAARELGSDVIELSTLRGIQNGAEATVLVERVTPARIHTAHEPFPEPPDGGSRFRSGLSQHDLGLGPDERRDFE